MLALPNEILHRILNNVDDPSVLTNCLKTSKSMRKAFFAKKEELLYRSYPEIWLLLRCFKAFDIVKNSDVVNRQEPIYISLRKYLGMPKRHIATMIEDGLEIDLSTMTPVMNHWSSMDYKTDGIVQDLPDREFVGTMAPIAIRNCSLLIQIFLLRSTLVEHLWFWELILSYSMDFKTERFWTYVVFAYDLKGLFRTIWQRRQWPWCDISLEDVPIVLTGEDVAWLLEVLPSFELYLDGITHFSPELMYLNTSSNPTWNWESFSSTVSLNNFLQYPELPWVDRHLIANPNIPLKTYITQGRMTFQQLIIYKPTLKLAEHAVNIPLLETLLTTETLMENIDKQDLLISCMVFKRFDLIRKYAKQFLSNDCSQLQLRSHDSMMHYLLRNT